VSTYPTAQTTRPGSVTIVVVLTWINAVLHLLLGVLLLVVAVAFGASGADATTRTIGTGLAVGLAIIYLIIGAVTAFVATRLGRGGRGSRMLLTVIEVITIITNVITWIVNNTAQQATSSIIGIVVAAVILALLWNQRANAFFESS
jgi:hypothetical protein